MSNPPISDLNNDICNASLGQIVALAGQYENPIPPYPLFYPNPQCQGTYSAFPNYFTGVNCTGTPDTLTPEDNCLIVVDGETKNPFLSDHVTPNPNVKYSPDEANVLKNMLISNMLYSAWTPPNFALVFFKGAPDASKTVGEQITFILPFNQPQADFCRQNVTFSDGSSFFDQSKTCDASSAVMNATHVVVYKSKDFNEMILDACMGTSTPFGANYDLTELWGNQTGECDDFMTGFCNQPNVQQILEPMPQYRDVCRCFEEQRRLDSIYEPFGIKVPVLCFGGNQPGDDISRACAFNEEAYKTQDMSKPVDGNACSFAECEAVAQNSEALKNKINQTGGGVICHGKFVQFPSLPSIAPAISPVPLVSSVIQKTTIPMWIWFIFGTGVLCLVLFIMALAFVT